ncbi:MAG: hypothetical protein ACE5PT_02875 [Gemmatimonadales bacterium]
MTFAGRIEEFDGPTPSVRYRWDPETEILSGVIEGAAGESGYTGAIELEDPAGAFVTLDLQDGALRAVEVVVWPETETVEDLSPPTEVVGGRLRVPPRPSQPGIALVEMDVAMRAERTPDSRSYRLSVGPRRKSKTYRLADNLLIEMDNAGQPAGFWLLNVPLFPEEKRRP